MESRRRNSISIPFSVGSGPLRNDYLSSPRLGNDGLSRRTSTFSLFAVLPRRIPLAILGVVGFVTFCWLILTSTPTTITDNHPWSNLRLPFIETAPETPALPIDFDSSPVPAEWACNPFKQFGRLSVDVDVPTNNIWKPFDRECPPSTLMSKLWKNSSTTGSVPVTGQSARSNGYTGTAEDDFESKERYPWLQDIMILLQGDSMERLHLTDFCNLVGGNLTNIDPHHPSSPPIFRRPPPTRFDEHGQETPGSIEAKRARIEAENSWDNRPASWFFTRPWVCDIKEYNATVVSVFTWGMQDMESVFQTEEFFHGPSTWLERFEHITKPLLANLAVEFDRPAILHPSFIELASGFWDLRGFTEQDFITESISKPYPLDSLIPFGNIGEEREEKWAREMTEAVKAVASYFPGKTGLVRDGPVISWRTLHHPKKNNYTPYSRAFPLDQLARLTLHNLRRDSFLSRPSTFATLKSMISRKKLLGQDPDLGLDERIRVSEYGALMLGQEHHFKDFLHPDVLPGSYLWSDMFVYEIKRAMLRIGRSRR